MPRARRATIFLFSRRGRHFCRFFASYGVRTFFSPKKGDRAKQWKDAKLVVTFPETAEGKAIEFRPGRLPCEMPEELPLSQPWSGLSKDTWFTRLTLESLTWQDSPEARDIYQPLEI